jgi:hypothetical protein
VVVAMGMQSCVGNRGGHRSSNDAATEKERKEIREEEKRNEERRKKKERKGKIKKEKEKMKVRKHIGYKKRYIIYF